MKKRVTCPFCSGDASELFGLAHTYVYQCTTRGCGLRFAMPQLRDSELAAAYRNLYYPGASGDEPGKYKPTPATVLEQVFVNLRGRVGSFQGRRILDFGCGNGDLSRLAQGFDLKPTGIEFDPVARKIASEESRIRVYPNLDTLELEEPDALFDFAVLWEVIEHLREPWMELVGIRGRMRSGGTLLLSTANANCLKARVQRAKWNNYTNPTHFYYFTRQALRSILMYAGFTGIREWFLPVAYPTHSFLRREIHRWLVKMRLHGALLFMAENPAE